MTPPTRDSIRTEITMVERLLNEMPKTRVIERQGLSERAENLRHQLAQIPPAPETIALTFRGAPVDGSRSITADFAGEALVAFNAAIGALAASFPANGAALEPGHVAPNRALKIVGIATDSFGFVLELPPPVIDPHLTEYAPEGQDRVEAAVQLAVSLMSAAQSDDEESFADKVAMVQTSAFASIQRFAQLVADAGATFCLRTDSSLLEVTDVAGVQRIAEGFDEKKIFEDASTATGILWVLPHSGQFELQVGEQETIRGHVAKHVVALGTMVGRLVTATLKQSTYGESRPRYTLMAARATEEK